MRIKDKLELIEGEKYWYIGVKYQSHWIIYKKSDNYKEGHDWSNMIVFDNEQEANEMKEKLQNYLRPFILK